MSVCSAGGGRLRAPSHATRHHSGPAGHPEAARPLAAARSQQPAWQAFPTRQAGRTVPPPVPARRKSETLCCKLTFPTAPVSAQRANSRRGATRNSFHCAVPASLACRAYTNCQKPRDAAQGRHRRWKLFSQLTSSNQIQEDSGTEGPAGPAVGPSKESLSDSLAGGGGGVGAQEGTMESSDCAPSSCATATPDPCGAAAAVGRRGGSVEGTAAGEPARRPSSSYSRTRRPS